MLSVIRGATTSYQIIRELGQGTYGQVFQVVDIRTQKNFACKIISKQLMWKYNANDMIRDEIKIQGALNHKNIVKIIETIEDPLNILIILEFCCNGTLEIPEKPFNEKQLFKVLHQILTGLDYLHCNQIIHRDIKLENILIGEDGVLKICDFGWATRAKDAEPVLCGTTEYMPPEVVSIQNYTFKIDVWSVGIIAYQLMHCVSPFKHKNQADLIKMIQTNDIRIDPNLSEDLKDLIRSMLNKDQFKRPTIREIYLSNWMKRLMREQKIFNKYEIEEMKLKSIQKRNIILKNVDNCGCIQKSISSNSQLTSSQNTYKSSLSTNPNSPFQSSRMLEQIFTFKETEFTSLPMPQFY